METAKANILNPEKYIGSLLTVLPESFAQAPKASVDDLLPWAEDAQRLLVVWIIERLRLSSFEPHAWRGVYWKQKLRIQISFESET